MEPKVRLIGALELVISWLMWPMYFILSFRPLQYCPPIKSSLHKLSAVQLAKAIRRGEHSSLEVVDMYIKRIREVNPLLNAVVEERFTDAREEAKAVDALVASKGKSVEALERDTPLLGVPITIKESCGVQGLSQSGGCLPRKGIKAEKDSEAVSLLRKAGAIVLCVTNTPELCLFWETNNLVTGRTNNPFNIHRTPGGSSGGEGALLGSGASLIGIGSDIAGSIRIPAMFNGVFGHKPSPDIVSLTGHYPWTPTLSKCLVMGPMSRYAEDLPLLMKIMSNGQLKLDEEVVLSKLNVFYMEEAGPSLVAVPVCEEIRNALKQAVKYLKDVENCTVKEEKFYELTDSVEISASVLLDLPDIPNLFDLSTKKGKDELSMYSELAKSLVGRSEFSVPGIMFMLMVEHRLLLSPENIQRYKKDNEELTKVFEKVLSDNGVFLYPTFPVPALHHNETFVKTSGVMYPMIFNTLGLPATHVPLGLDKNGLPIGIQIIAAPHQDRLCLAVAKALEKGFGGWICPPSSP